ncbi:MAG TPA: NAD(P)-binding domain-containing protein [Acidimicrobiia bacterium]|nr:NAD(P)-binding domain-containing protein [Acidimicrobiia bacterium]
MDEELPVCVIGAGVAGLTAIKALAERSIAFDCYEMGSAIGGLWRYDNDNGRSPAYASLHVDTSKERIALEDLPMPKHWPTYLHHSQVLAYLEAYARAFGLAPLITFRHEVISVVPLEDRWSVTVRDLASGAETTRAYRAVIVANGHHWDPNLPETDGPFAGHIMHAQAYRTPEPFIGKDVVVVGAGNTAVDLAAELSWHARSVTLSTRSGAHVLPRYVFGRPLDRWSTRMSTRLPLAVQRPLYRTLLFLARGRQGSYGFPTPAAPILSQHPTVNQDILRLVKDGHVAVRRGLSRTTEHEAVFVDGTTTRCDVIIYATGYTISFPFLEEVVEVVENRVDLYRRVVSVDYPGLFFVGLIQPVGALPPLAEQQAKWVSRLLGGAPLPTVATMKAAIARDREELAARYEDRPRHTIQVDYWSYLDEMRAICNEIDADADAALQVAAP